MWVFRKSEKDGTYEVGFISVDYFEDVYNFGTIEEAEAKVNYLNGGTDCKPHDVELSYNSLSYNSKIYEGIE